jgi:GUN4-like
MMKTDETMLEKLDITLAKAVETDESHEWLMADEITYKIIMKTAQLMGWNGRGLVQQLFFYNTKYLLPYAESSLIDTSIVIESPLIDTLRAIDSLWTKHTHGHFGLSAQKSVRENCKTLKDFYLCVDWILDSDKSSAASFFFGYPLEVWYTRAEYSFLGKIEQHIQISASRKASIKAAKGNLPYCTYLVPSIFNAKLS